MKLSDLFAQDEFVITSEVGPPKGTNTEEMLEHGKLLNDHVAAVNITDQQSSVMRLGSLVSSLLLKREGVEPIYQVACRDRNRIALQSDLLSAWAGGVENVLCLTGDYVSLGDFPDARPVYDLDSVSLLAAARQLNEGQDLAGNELAGAPSFCLGAVVTPTAEPIELQLIKMEKKARAGAQFFQTQGIFDPPQFADFMKQANELGVPVLAGIILLKSPGMARFMNQHVAGIQVPDALIGELAEADNRLDKAIEIASRIIGQVKEVCQGVHIMPVGWERHVPAVLDAAGL